MSDCDPTQISSHEETSLPPFQPLEPPQFDQAGFEAAWPDLANRLRGSLIARGVPAQDRDDVVQETALRVYRAWADLDPTRHPWPFVITVGMNYWRDICRERTSRGTDPHPTVALDSAADLDVERTVLARHELETVGAAFRMLAPEQRRLLLATDELAPTVRPLLPAERVARMRVRRQLARAVGRASALAALAWLRRPARTAGAVATAYAGAMAAAVFSLPAPAIVPNAAPLHQVVRHPAAAASAPEHATRHMSRLAIAVTAAPPAARVASLVDESSPAGARFVRHPSQAAPTRVCSPEKPSTVGVPVTVNVHISSADLGVGGAKRQSSSGHLHTPSIDVRSGEGCVRVGALSAR